MPIGWRAGARPFGDEIGEAGVRFGEDVLELTKLDEEALDAVALSREALSLAFRGHPGSSDFGVKAEHYRFPDERLVVIILSNRYPLPGPKDDNGRLAGRVAGMALGR